MTIEAILLGRGGELDRRKIVADDDDDPMEISEAIWDAIDDWILSPGDTIKITES